MKPVNLAAAGWMREVLALSKQTRLTTGQLLMLLSGYRTWRNLRREVSALDARQPWITSPAVAVLERLAEQGSLAVEWGAGGSTLFLLDRGMQVTTVEHDPEWLAIVRSRLSAEATSQWNPILVRPSLRRSDDPWDPSDWARFHSGESDHVDYSEYCQAPMADSSVKLVLIDGRARPACLAYAASAFPSAYLVLDQSERHYYAKSMNNVSQHRGNPNHYPGAIRGLNHLSRTSVWKPVRGVDA